MASSTRDDTADSPEVLRVRGELLNGSPCVSVYYETTSCLTFRAKLLPVEDGNAYELREWSEVEFVDGRTIRTFDTVRVPEVVRGAVDRPVQVPEQ